jgi:hypothetical protein
MPGWLGAPGRIRTSDPRLRRPSLYPTELRALDFTIVSKLPESAMDRIGSAERRGSSTTVIPEQSTSICARACAMTAVDR